MCLLGIAWRLHPRYPLIVAGNRDEFHERPSAPAAWWEAAGHVLGGRDLVAGGTWLAISRGGRFGVVINHPGRPPAAAHGASRGHLVRDFVAGDKPSGRFLDAVQTEELRYAGFCLVVGTQVQLRGFVSPKGTHAGRWTLPPGISVITNAPLETPAPKAGYLDNALRSLLGGSDVDAEDLFAVLARREAVGPVGLGDGGNGPVMGRTPFVVGEHFGTRASTLLMIDDGGICWFEEHRFDAAGQLTGTTSEQFEITA